jgi:hypothetical protein
MNFLTITAHISAEIAASVEELLGRTVVREKKSRTTVTKDHNGTRGERCEDSKHKKSADKNPVVILCALCVRPLPREIQTTIDLKRVDCGTEVSIVQEGVPAAIPPSACYLGWQESLILLAKLVEAEIPD